MKKLIFLITLTLAFSGHCATLYIQHLGLNDYYGYSTLPSLPAFPFSAQEIERPIVYFRPPLGCVFRPFEPRREPGTLALTDSPTDNNGGVKVKIIGEWKYVSPSEVTLTAPTTRVGNGHWYKYVYLGVWGPGAQYLQVYCNTSVPRDGENVELDGEMSVHWYGRSTENSSDSWRFTRAPLRTKQVFVYAAISNQYVLMESYNAHLTDQNSTQVILKMGSANTFNAPVQVRVALNDPLRDVILFSKNLGVITDGQTVSMMSGDEVRVKLSDTAPPGKRTHNIKFTVSLP